MSRIDVTRNGDFNEALRVLAAHRRSAGSGFGGRFVQIFLGMKFFQESIPSIYSGRFIASELLQSLLDDLYAKESRAANECVLSLFEANFLARTGMVGPGKASAQNTWRNNFNLQKGIGCYAPVSDLSSPSFLHEHRAQCQYLLPESPGVLAGARCALNSGAAYRNENHKKWLRISQDKSGYASVDLRSTSNFLPVVAPRGVRIPIVPLIIALYHDANPGLLLGQRESVSLLEFMADFNFSRREIGSYFEVPTELSASLEATDVAHVSRLPRVHPGRSEEGRGRVNEIPELYIPDSATDTPAPASNTGWSAEQYVRSALVSAGWDVHIVSRQNLGYDIFARKGTKKIYVEVKSSVATCSPSLTAREWHQANYYGREYILAIIENCSDLGVNNIFWVPDPTGSCNGVEVMSIAYRISRSSWGPRTVGLAELG